MPRARQGVYYHGNIWLTDEVREYLASKGVNMTIEGSFEEDEDFAMKYIINNNANGIFKDMRFRREQGLEDHTGMSHCGEHLQIWCQTTRKMTLTGLLASENFLTKLLRSGGGPGGHLKPAAAGADDSYLDKANTHIKGHDKICCNKMKMPQEQPMLDMFVKEANKWEQAKTLYTWQGMMKEHIENILDTPTRDLMKNKWISRRIKIVQEQEGNKGKSVMISWFEWKYHPYILIIPAIAGDSCSDLIQFVASKLQGRRQRDMPKIVMFDLPRAITGSLSPHKLQQLFAGIEMIKNGRVFDTRYEAKEVRWFQHPAVVIFCNDMPKGLEKTMSHDRRDRTYIVRNYMDERDESYGINIDVDYILTNEEPEDPMLQVNYDHLAGGDAV